MSEQAKRTGPPPMPKAKPAAEPELSVESSGPPPASAPPPVKREADKIMEPLPNALTIFLVGVGVVVLAGLVYPPTVLVTLPILVMIGFWITYLGYSIWQTLPKGILGGPSLAARQTPLWKYGLLLINLGMAPLMLALIGFAVGRNSGVEMLYVLLVIFGVLVIPATLLARAKATRQLEKVNRHDS